MAFTLQLAQDLVEVEAGGNTPVSVTVVNKGQETDRYEHEIEGNDAEWKAIPVPIFAVEPEETRTERVFVKPPRMSESLAGNYPFVIRLRSLESGEQKSAQGVVHLRPYHHISLEIDPKKGSVSPFSNRNQFEVTVVNLGNTEHTVQLVGSDPEDACTYDFDGDQVSVGPGQQKAVGVVVTPASHPIFSSGKLIGFTVSARSVDTPSVVATAQAQLERRSLIT
ncbi:MAG TPA: FixG Ig-like domain-containing protein, partial [Fimbriimonas sp.]|nr:FixG Ig-like domain-containing protein [Fimbriimonas sp.]